MHQGLPRGSGIGGLLFNWRWWSLWTLNSIRKWFYATLQSFPRRKFLNHCPCRDWREELYLLMYFQTKKYLKTYSLIFDICDLILMLSVLIPCLGHNITYWFGLLTFFFLSREEYQMVEMSYADHDYHPGCSLMAIIIRTWYFSHLICFTKKKCQCTLDVFYSILLTLTSYDLRTYSMEMIDVQSKIIPWCCSHPLKKKL